MNYLKGYRLEKDLNVLPYFFFNGKEGENQSLNLSNELNQLTSNLTQSKEFLKNIESVLSGGLDEYEANTNLISLNLSEENTIIENYLFESPKIEIKTNYIKKVVIEKISFHEKQDINLIKNVIRKGIKELKENKQRDTAGYFVYLEGEELFIRFPFSEEQLNNLVIDIDIKL